MTLDEFIAKENWPNGSVGFRLRGGRVVWTCARYTEGNRNGLASVSRIVHEGGQAFTREQYADPNTVIHFVFGEKKLGAPNAGNAASPAVPSPDITRAPTHP